MQKLNTPLLPFPIYALVFDKDNVPEYIQYALMERGYDPTPIGDVALDEAKCTEYIDLLAGIAVNALGSRNQLANQFRARSSESATGILRTML